MKSKGGPFGDKNFQTQGGYRPKGDRWVTKTCETQGGPLGDKKHEKPKGGPLGDKKHVKPKGGPFGGNMRNQRGNLE